MIASAALGILLHDRRIGTLARLDGDRSTFEFDQSAYAIHRIDHGKGSAIRVEGFAQVYGVTGSGGKGQGTE